MFFTLSKIIWFIISPLSFIWLLIGAGLVLSRFNKTKSFGKYALTTGTILFVTLGFFPIGYNLQSYLEHEATQIHADNINPQDYAGIVILGGCMDAHLSHIYNTAIINGSCERILDGIKLHKKFPELPMIYSGGSGSVHNQSQKGADAAKRLMQDMGVNTQNIRFERASKNTYENMLLSKNMTKKDNQKPWLLITSALHMPRASRVFCHGGWNIQPYPVDYNTRKERVWNTISPLHNFQYLTQATKEIVGIVAYGVTGKLSMNACA